MAVQYLCEGYQVTEYRACRTIRYGRSMYRYRSWRELYTALRHRIGELLQARVHYGYRKIKTLLTREGWAVGKKLIYRRYLEEGLALCPGTPRRGQAMMLRQDLVKPHRLNQV